MLLACAATPELNYQTDIQHPWTNTDGDMIKGGKLQFKDGLMGVPNKPGLGVEIDGYSLAEGHEALKQGSPSNRSEMILSIDPDAKPRDGSWTGFNFPNYIKRLQHGLDRLRGFRIEMRD